MNLTTRFNKWWVFEILFLIFAVILVESYIRKNQGKTTSPQNQAIEEQRLPQEDRKSDSRFSEFSISRAEVCLDIDVDEGKPLLCKKSFHRTVDRLYCFTQVQGIRTTSYVIHRWYHQNKPRAEVQLDISPQQTKTWSSIEMRPTLAGQWYVDILATNGKILETVNFELD